MVVPAQAGDGTVQFIKAQGSDATYDVMQNLDRAYNNSAGCNTVTGTTSPDNSTCTSNGPVTTENNDHDLGVSFFPVGSATASGSSTASGCRA